jgi:hypothetical protein
MHNCEGENIMFLIYMYICASPQENLDLDTLILHASAYMRSHTKMLKL